MSGDALKLRRVLCALDVDSGARAPLSIASVLAQSFEASVDALYAPAPLQAFGGRVERVRSLIAEHNARERLQAMLAPFAGAVRVESFITRGQAGDVILSHAEQHDSDLIVLGRPAGSADRSGGVSVPVASAANCAVLTVRGVTPACAFRRVLMPLGGSLDPMPALHWAIALAARFDATIELVGVAPARSGFWRALGPSSYSVPELRSQRRTLAQTKLVLSKLSAAGVRVSERSEQLEPDQVIDLVREGSFDLVVAGLQRIGDQAEHSETLVRALRRRTEVAVLTARALGVSALLGRGNATVTELYPYERVLGIPA